MMIYSFGVFGVACSPMSSSLVTITAIVAPLTRIVDLGRVGYRGFNRLASVVVSVANCGEC